MARDLETLDLRSRQQFRRWLAEHHASSPGIWIVFHKGHAGTPSIPYEDAVREALCFGWIDSLVKRLDEARYARKFTPRRSGSRWSAINQRRWRELEAAGLLKPAGRAAAPNGRTYAVPPGVPELPDYIAAAFRKDPKAWRFFQSLAPGYRRHFVSWIHTAKRPETRERRIRESVALLASEKRLGLK